MIYEKLRTLPRSEFPIVSFKISVTGSRLKFNIRLCEQLSQIIVDFVINVSGSILVMQLDFVGIPVELVLPTQLTLRLTPYLLKNMGFRLLHQLI